MKSKEVSSKPVSVGIDRIKGNRLSMYFTDAKLAKFAQIDMTYNEAIILRNRLRAALLIKEVNAKDGPVAQLVRAADS